MLASGAKKQQDQLAKMFETGNAEGLGQTLGAIVFSLVNPNKIAKATNITDLLKDTKNAIANKRTGQVREEAAKGAKAAKIETPAEQIARLSQNSSAKTHELEAAARLENDTGSKIKMIEPPPPGPDGNRPKGPDFKFDSGPYAGQTGDFMFTFEPDKVAMINATFDRNWDKTLDSLNKHLTKADKVVLVYGNLTPANRQKVSNWIRTLPPAQRAQIIIRR